MNSPVAKFAAAVREINRLLENKVYLAVQEFSVAGAPPKPSDFDRMQFDKKDVDQLQNCKPGDCDLQVFDVANFQKQIDWKSPGKYDQANKLVREKIFQAMTVYLQGGLKPFGSYSDRSKPLNLYESTKSMLDTSYYLPQDKASGIYRHIVDYPEGKLPGAEGFFYWEKIDFGQEPTIRVNHVTLFPGGAGPVKFLVANKQLYASRYMRVALQMYYCVPDTQNPNKPGFYLIEMNDSRFPILVVRSSASCGRLRAERPTMRPATRSRCTKG